ncbi:hypothetical protein NVP1240O_18 [Vibrio phage 1.240.O._10N.261.52.F8]|nr:hypothetical protein NVP1240O_18 [Vibrio phage 1.240.O._10N.261.52.F8]
MAVIGNVDDLDVFEYGGKPILPEKESYTVKLQNGLQVSDVSAGMSKQQIQFLNAPYYVNVTYVGLDSFKMAYIENFLNNNRGQKFVTTLLIGGTELDQFVVQQMDVANIKRTGFNGSLSITLEVEPAIDQCFMQFIMDYGQCMGSDTAGVFCYTNEGVKVWP